MMDFIGNRFKFFILSGSILLIALSMALVKGIQLDIQFKGGAIITYTYEGEVDKNKAGSIIEGAIGNSVTVQETVDVATGVKKMVINLATNQGIDNEELSAMDVALKSNFPSNNLNLLQSNSVEPTIGQQFLFKCLIALAFASLVMVIYVAWRFKRISGWSAGVMAVVALVHDVLIVFSMFIIFQIPLNDNFMAVALTIVGYSLNDTIVIYDRIRENRRLYGAKMKLDELVNKSINQSFVRSINTSMTTTIAMLSVGVISLLFNITSIISFAFPMIVGLLSGTYSSICIAGPLWVMWQQHKQKSKARA